MRGRAAIDQALRDLRADVLRPDAYECLRPSHLARMVEVRRRRRMRLGQDVSVLFENRETVLAQLHEQLRAGGSWEEARLVREAEDLAAMVPREGELAATLMIDGGRCEDGQRLSARIASRAPVVVLEVGRCRIAGIVAEHAPDPTCPVQYLRFTVGDGIGGLLRDSDVIASLVLDDGINRVSERLPWETRSDLASEIESWSTAAPTEGTALALASISA